MGELIEFPTGRVRTKKSGTIELSKIKNAPVDRNLMERLELIKNLQLDQLSTESLRRISHVVSVELALSGNKEGVR